MNVDTRGSSVSNAILVDSDDEGAHRTSATDPTAQAFSSTNPATPSTGDPSQAPKSKPKPKKPIALHTRPYQQEMLDLSLRRNVIVALDTGSGKTHIAILRMKGYLEGSGGKLAWFLTPTVALCTQQHAVLALSLPFPCALLSGAAYPDQWKSAGLWEGVVRSHRVVVSTPQVLLDALRHGYLSLGRDVGLLVFDEAHHCVEKHPYRMVMQEFYFSLPPRPLTPSNAPSPSDTNAVQGSPSPASPHPAGPTRHPPAGQAQTPRAIVAEGASVGEGEGDAGGEKPVCRPAILGLTASPIYGSGDVDRAFRAIESNLDALIVTPSSSRSSLAAHVHRPIFKHVGFFPPPLPGLTSPNVNNGEPAFSTNLAALQAVIASLDIEKDPYVIGLRRQLAKLAPPPASTAPRDAYGNPQVDPAALSPEYRRLDQKLSKVLSRKDSFAHKGLRDFERAASDILWTVGGWACDWFVWSVVRRARRASRAVGGANNPLGLQLATWRNEEKRYLAGILDGLTLSPPSYFEDDIVGECSDKVRVLIQALLDEKEEAESHSSSSVTSGGGSANGGDEGDGGKEPEREGFSGLVFVQRRDAVLALAELLSHHPATKDAFRIGTLLGSSDSVYRHAFMDITRGIVPGVKDERGEDGEGDEGEAKMEVDETHGEPETSGATGPSEKDKGKGRATPRTRTAGPPPNNPNAAAKKLKAHSAKAQQATLAEFRSGEKNLIISTAVAEEGIDIQACGCVVRWDAPQNMASWVQSRGRARRKRSTFVLLYDVEEDRAMGNVAKWTEMEERMVQESRMRVARAEAGGAGAGRGQGGEENVGEDGREEVGDWDEELKSEETGATINPHSAVSHLSHFCSIISRSGGSDNQPIYDLSPPDYPLAFHTSTAFSSPSPAPYTQPQFQGPWSSTVHLPRSLPIPQRAFSTLPDEYGSKLAAHRHAAFKAYKALHGWGLLNENLLPFGSAGKGEEEEEVRRLLREVERREGLVGVKVQIDPWRAEEKAGGDGSMSPVTPTVETEEQRWYLSEMRVDGLPPLVLFTLRPMLDVKREEGPELFRPGRETTRVSVTPMRKASPGTGGDEDEERYETVEGDDDVVKKAREYTRMLFWCFYSGRMDWEKTDYAYLVLPISLCPSLSKSVSTPSTRFTSSTFSNNLSRSSSTSSTTLSSTEDDTWADRRDKLASLRETGILKPSKNDMAFMLPADVYAEHFAFSQDAVVVRKHSGQGKPMRFVGWQFEKLDEEGEEQVRDAYKSKKRRKVVEKEDKGKDVLVERTNAGDAMDVDHAEEKVVEDVLMGVIEAEKEKVEEEEEEKLEITYPLIIAEPFPPRTNFLHPLPAAKPNSTSKDQAKTGDGEEEPRKDWKDYLLPSMSSIAFYSYEEVEYAFLLPSILRWLGHNLTVASFQQRHWSSIPPPPSPPIPSPLLSIPRPLLTIALTAPVSGERYNYQRLETLGDAVLKYVVGVQLYAEYPMWHEGYLTRAKDHAVNNAKLAKECVKRGVFRWILREIMMGKKWLPTYVGGASVKGEVGKVEESGGVEPGGGEGTTDTTPGAKPVEPVELGEGSVAPEAGSTTGAVPAAEEKEDVPAAVEGTPKKTRKKKGKGKSQGKSQEMGTKVLADVVEALIGAAYEHGGFDLGQECTKFFDLGVKWQPLSSRLTRIRANIRPDTDLGVEIPSQIADVETMIGYTFQHKILLIEALTHSSYREHISTISYERLEFLGDSILDMVATDYLYHVPDKEYSPGHMHIRKSAVVNGHFLAYICLGLKHTSRAVMPQPVANADGDLPRNPYTSKMEFTSGVDEQEIYLWQCLLHSNQQVLDDQTNTFTRYEKWKDDIRHALEHETVFPWAALTRLQAPKFFSDMVESIIGAVYLDSGGSMDTVKQFLRGIGILPVLERIVTDGVDVFHPVSRVAMWASRNEKTVEYTFEHSRGDISCVLLVDGEEEVRETEKYRGKSSQEEVKFAAAEKAIKQFRLRDAGAKSGLGDKKDKVKGRPKRKRGSA